MVLLNMLPLLLQIFCTVLRLRQTYKIIWRCREPSYTIYGFQIVC